jgi:hypothetical protein
MNKNTPRATRSATVTTTGMNTVKSGVMTAAIIGATTARNIAVKTEVEAAAKVMNTATVVAATDRITSRFIMA